MNIFGNTQPIINFNHSSSPSDSTVQQSVQLLQASSPTAPEPHVPLPTAGGPKELCQQLPQPESRRPRLQLPTASRCGRCCFHSISVTSSGEQQDTNFDTFTSFGESLKFKSLKLYLDILFSRYL